MRKHHVHLLHLGMLLAVTICQSVAFDGQAAPAGPRSASIAVSISMQEDKVPVGQSPLVVLTVKNLTAHEVPLHTGPSMYRVHVLGKKGEPPTKRLQRVISGKLRPGEPDLMLSDFVRSIAPGQAGTEKFDLAYFYDLSQPGEYSVYLEVYDESGKWLRTNTAKFEVLAPAQ